MKPLLKRVALVILECLELGLPDDGIDEAGHYVRNCGGSRSASTAAAAACCCSSFAAA